jgi:hypothetical protein
MTRIRENWDWEPRASRESERELEFCSFKRVLEEQLEVSL